MLSFGSSFLIPPSFISMSFTYNPKKKKRARTHGFLKRMETKNGKQVIQRRRAKGRKRLAVQPK